MNREGSDAVGFSGYTGSPGLPGQSSWATRNDWRKERPNKKNEKGPVTAKRDKKQTLRKEMEQERFKEIGIINSILGEEGVTRYNALKNRHGREVAPHANNFLQIYSNTKGQVEEGMIVTYQRRMERLRRKIEDSHGRALQQRLTDSTGTITLPGLGSATTVKVHSEEVSTETISHGKKESEQKKAKELQMPQVATGRLSSTSVGAKEGGQTGTSQPAQENAGSRTEVVEVKELKSLESLRFGNVFGQTGIYYTEKKIPAILRVENGVAVEMVEDKTRKKNKRETAAYIEKDTYEISSCKLYVVSRKKRLFSWCFSKKSSVSFYPLGKEMTLLNLLSKRGGYELLAKNTQTNKCVRILIPTLEMCLQDGRYKNHFYRMDSQELFLRWILVFKLRIDAVDLWNGRELWEAINRN
jgi:hypothetical protein